MYNYFFIFLPNFLIIVFNILNALLIGKNYYLLIIPFFNIIVVYYWTLKEPHIMNYGAVFVLGFLIDLLSGMPFGINMVTLLLFRYFVSQRLEYLRNLSFSYSWLAFIFIMVIIVMLQYLIMQIFDYSNWSFDTFFNALVMTTLFYPIIFIVNHWLCLLIKK